MLYGELPEIKQESGESLRGITIRVPNPPKTAILRLPDSKEMLGCLAQQKSIRRSLGRRKSQTESVPNPKANMDLFLKIRLDNGPEFDEYEAANAISKLTYCEVTECQRQGDEYRIVLKTAFGETAHLLRVPTARDASLYRRSVVASTDLPHGQEELRFRTEPAVDLYDATVSKIEGYAAGIGTKDVPPHHKSAVVIELVQAQDELDGLIDPNS